MFGDKDNLVSKEQTLGSIIEHNAECDHFIAIAAVLVRNPDRVIASNLNFNICRAPIKTTQFSGISSLTME